MNVLEHMRNEQRKDDEDMELAAQVARDVNPPTEAPSTNATPNMQRATSEDHSVSNLPGKGERRPANPTTMSSRRRLNMGEAEGGEGGDDPMMGNALVAFNANGATEASMSQIQKIPVIPRQPELGIFTEQRTACLPVTIYLSMNQLATSAPVAMRIRLNNHVNILEKTTLTKQTVNTERARGVSNDYAVRFPHTLTNWTHLVPFPHTVVGATAPTATESSFGAINDDAVAPAWRAFYHGCWQAYSNYKTEYKITILNAANDKEDLSHVKLFSKTERYTASTGESGNLIPRDAPIGDMLQWGATQHSIHPRNVNTESSDYTVIDGVWTPNSVKQLNVFNDEDVKTWYATGTSAAPAQNDKVFDHLTVMAYNHDMYPIAPRQPENAIVGSESGDGGRDFRELKTPSQTSINMRIDLKYYVVFKDLARHLRYPKYNDSNVTLLTVDNIKQYPREQELVPIDTANQKW